MLIEFLTQDENKKYFCLCQPKLLPGDEPAEWREESSQNSQGQIVGGFPRSSPGRGRGGDLEDGHSPPLSPGLSLLPAHSISPTASGITEVDTKGAS